MDNIFIISTSNTIKAYSSFSRLCSENNIDKSKINKKNLPVKIGDITIVKVELDTRI
jgi:hypothetical protein